MTPFRLVVWGRILDLVTTITFLKLTERFSDWIHLALVETHPFTLTLWGNILELILIGIIYLVEEIIKNEKAPIGYRVILYLICIPFLLPVLVNVINILWYLKEIIVFCLGWV